MSFNFNELNLSDAEVSTGSQILKPGKYVVKVRDVKVGPSKKNDGSMVMSLKVEDVNGQGSLNHWVNLLVKSSAEATKIGRSELKSLLHWGGHPNPDRPGDVSLISGLTVGVVVKEENYQKTNNFGQTEERKGSSIAAFIDPAEVDPSKYTPRPAPVKKSGAAGALDDDIPF